MDYYPLIDEYLNSQRDSITIKTREAERKAITIGVDFLKQRGLDAPNETFYDELKAHLLSSLNVSTVHKKYMPPIRRFFEWTAQKGYAQMTEITPDTLQPEAKKADDEAPANEAVIDAPATSLQPVENSTRRKPGRKMRADEKSTEKFSIYLTPSLMRDAKDLASLEGLKFADYVYSLIQHDVETRRSKIEALRALRA